MAAVYLHILKSELPLKGKSLTPTIADDARNPTNGELKCVKANTDTCFECVAGGSYVVVMFTASHGTLEHTPIYNGSFVTNWKS